jgi:fructokinase
MKANRPLIVGVGEVLWDILPEGPQLGGAPANFTYFANALGADALLISRVGVDDLGDKTLARLEAGGLRLDGLSRDPTHETGKATVSVDAHGVPRFRIHEPSAWDYLEATPSIVEELKVADAICFGTLGGRAEKSRRTIHELVEHTPPQAIRILDLNLRAPFYEPEIIRQALLLANMLKINEVELEELSGLLALPGSEIDRLRSIQERYELRLVALTKGAAGSILVQGAALSCHPGIPTEVKDTIGAGDAFTAALVAGLLRGFSLETVHAQSAELAAYVCSQSGAMPPVPPQIMQWQSSSPVADAAKSAQ